MRTSPIEDSFLPGKTFLNRLCICRFFDDRSADLCNTTLPCRTGAYTERTELRSLGELEGAVRDVFAMPRAPVPQAVTALEQHIGRSLFRMR